jgi:hypothetical protein
MRNTMLGIAAVMVAASPVMADGLPVAPYTAGPTYQREVHTYEREYRTIPPAVVVAPRVVEAPVVSETVIVRRPVVVAPPPWWSRSIRCLESRPGCTRMEAIPGGEEARGVTGSIFTDGGDGKAPKRGLSFL